MSCSSKVPPSVHHRSRVDVWHDPDRPFPEHPHLLADLRNAARQAYDPDKTGVVIPCESITAADAARETTRLLVEATCPVFNAVFQYADSFVRADVLLPDRTDGNTRWKLILHVPTRSIRPWQLDVISTQVRFALKSGIRLATIQIAHIDSNYRHLSCWEPFARMFRLIDVSDEVLDRCPTWPGPPSLALLSASPAAPRTIPHLDTRPPSIKTRSSSVTLEQDAIQALKLLSRHMRVLDKRDNYDLQFSLENRSPEEALKSRLHSRNFQIPTSAALGLPATFLQFINVSHAVPHWDLAQPYQQTPIFATALTFDGHRWSRHPAFKSLSKTNPAACLFEWLHETCGHHGPIFIRDAHAHALEIAALSETLEPDETAEANSLIQRFIDLPKLVKTHYPEFGISPHRMHHRSKQITTSKRKLNRFRQAIIHALFEQYTTPTPSTQRQHKIGQTLQHAAESECATLARLWHITQNH